MADWNGEYISPYAEHGKKSELVKKITVSIPLKVLKVLTDERTRRQVNNLRHQPTVNCCAKPSCMLILASRCRRTKTYVKIALMIFLPKPNV